MIGIEKDKVGSEVQITSFSWLHELRHRGEICFKPISIAVNYCVTLLCYVVT